jgi:hypothetical protein
MEQTNRRGRQMAAAVASDTNESDKGRGCLIA